MRSSLLVACLLAGEGMTVVTAIPTKERTTNPRLLFAPRDIYRQFRSGWTILVQSKDGHGWDAREKEKKKQQNVRAQCMGLPACVTGMGMHMPVCHYRTVGSYVAARAVVPRTHGRRRHPDGGSTGESEDIYDTISLGDVRIIHRHGVVLGETELLGSYPLRAWALFATMPSHQCVCNKKPRAGRHRYETTTSVRWLLIRGFVFATMVSSYPFLRYVRRRPAAPNPSFLLLYTVAGLASYHDG